MSRRSKNSGRDRAGMDLGWANQGEASAAPFRSAASGLLSTNAPIVRKVRCAVYTRKSSDEGLDVSTWPSTASTPSARPAKPMWLVGGGSGIRTRDTVSRIHTFQACAFNHSATPPLFVLRDKRINILVPVCATPLS